METDHKHVWAANGCYCGAKQCQHWAATPRTGESYVELWRCDLVAVGHPHCEGHRNLEVRPIPRSRWMRRHGLSKIRVIVKSAGAR